MRYEVTVSSFEHGTLARLYQGINEVEATNIATAATEAVRVTHGNGTVTLRKGIETVSHWECKDGIAIPQLLTRKK